MVRLYALIHDISHLPFGHTLEDELGIFTRHDMHPERVTRLFYTDASEIGALLKKNSYSRAVRELMQTPEGGPFAYIKEFVDSAVGSDVLDYINRDAYYCGLDNRVDSVIFRSFSIAELHASPHVATRPYGTYGLRYDAEYALEDMFMERYALFLKVYTHRTKIAAGAMLGRAVCQALRFEKELAEQDIEWMGDTELLVRLKASSHRLTAQLAQALWYRRLYKQIYAASILNDDSSILISQADARTRELDYLFDPYRRIEEENRIAKEANLNEGDVLLYFPKTAPGVKKIKYYRERMTGPTEIRPQSHPAHVAIEHRHLRLWTAYAFVRPGTDNLAGRRVAERVSEIFGPNQGERHLPA